MPKLPDDRVYWRDKPIEPQPPRAPQAWGLIWIIGGIALLGLLGGAITAIFGPP